MRVSPDVVVVGGGVVGAASALELARLGARVTLVERSELAAGASGRNHGLLLSPLDPALVPMARASAELYEEVAPEAPVPFHLDPEPLGFLLLCGEDPAEQEAAGAEVEAAAACGVEAEPVEADRIRELEPEVAPTLVRGWLLRDGRRLDPAALTVSLALLARQAGAEVLTHRAVRALRVEGGAVRGVVTDRGEVPAGTVVVAAGPWTPSLLRPVGIHLPVTGLRGWLVHLGPESSSGRPPVSRLVGRAGWHVPPSPEPTPPVRASDVTGGPVPARVGTMLQPNRDGTLLVGGSRQPVLAGEPEDPEVPHRLLREAIRVVPAVGRAPVLGAWWGVRPATPDGRPFVGEVGEGLVVAAGHGSVGVILGGGTGRLVAALVLGRDPPFDPAPVDPGREGRGR